MTKVAVDTLLLGDLHLLDRHGREETQQRTVGTEETAEGATRKYRNNKQQNTERQQLHVTTQTEDTDKGVELAHQEAAVRHGVEDGEYKVEPRQ